MLVVLAILVELYRSKLKLRSRIVFLALEPPNLQLYGHHLSRRAGGQREPVDCSYMHPHGIPPYPWCLLMELKALKLPWKSDKEHHCRRCFSSLQEG
ncbi:hypothetical protein MUK42_37106 [Musa troglodytarum]|uniref:Uncharacterized protein n=1 Tax=Musa troglodytarum TaxID=320322 RepID=A0A9E7GNN8_9LILI|nr:hypothetical protein MUK42_37106 [Musa troglodytarum]